MVLLMSTYILYFYGVLTDIKPDEFFEFNMFSDNNIRGHLFKIVK